VAPRVEQKTFLLLLVLVTLAFGMVLWPFYGAVFWAAVLALLFSPLRRRLLARMGDKPNLATFATLALCLVIVGIPAALIAASLVDEVSGVVRRVQSGELNVGGYAQRVFDALPQWLSKLLARFGLRDFSGLQQKLTASLTTGSQAIASKALEIGQNTVDLLVDCFIMLYLLYFLLRDGAALTQRIQQAIPLEMRHKKQLGAKFATVIRATVKGNVIVALAQGALGGLALGVLGIHAAVLWAVVMALLSLLPAIGAALVWAPIALYLLATGDVAKGFGLIAWGVIVIGLVDNLLRPLLVGKDTKLPDWLVLISTVGGMALFGLNGFVIGPAVAAMFIAVWDLFASAPEVHVEEQTSEPTPPHID
jgi:predicted PurR-regulated permease PerM